MQFRLNKSANSVTLHIDTQEQALKLATDFIKLAGMKPFPDGSTLLMHETQPKVEGKQQHADVRVLSGRRRAKK